MPIPLLDLSLQHRSLAPEITAAMASVIDSQHFIGGEQVSLFEDEVAHLLGVPATVGCASGSDALLLALWALGIGPGDEVITTPFTFFATAGAICRLGATPVFVDIQAGSFNIDPDGIEAAITERTRAIIPVHLFGVPADMVRINHIAKAHDLAVVEDAAQSIGATLHGCESGAMGDLGCFSFFPSKNLGAWGDGGLVSASTAALSEQVRCLRSHGSYPRKYFHSTIGCNSRLDALQAAILRVKLPHLGSWNELRRQRVGRYQQLCSEKGLSEHVTFQQVIEGAVPVFHQCVVRVQRRDALKAHLQERGIGCAVYYPKPLHLQECFEQLGYSEGQLPVTEHACTEVLALPIFPELTEAQQDEVITALADFILAKPR
jgi:dTDP-4-amino-4,6-dideoxygalactose transaminase